MRDTETAGTNETKGAERPGNASACAESPVRLVKKCPYEGLLSFFMPKGQIESNITSYEAICAR
ncbi:hypothetical protein PCAR4_320058 [Paraburkholderia caribensis]|nr:hypothetical protein PCAR4_320058 [Paraburkholderia caribensis]